VRAKVSDDFDAMRLNMAYRSGHFAAQKKQNALLQAVPTQLHQPFDGINSITGEV